MKIAGKHSLNYEKLRAGARRGSLFELRARGTLDDAQIVERLNTLGFKTYERFVRDKEDRTKIILYKVTKPTKHVAHQQYAKKQTSWLRQAYEQLQQASGLLVWGQG